MEIDFHWRQSSQNQQGTGCCWDLAFIILIKREIGHREGDKEKGSSFLLAFTVKYSRSVHLNALKLINVMSRDSSRRYFLSEQFATSVSSYVTLALLISQKLQQSKI